MNKYIGKKTLRLSALLGIFTTMSVLYIQDVKPMEIDWNYVGGSSPVPQKPIDKGQEGWEIVKLPSEGKKIHTTWPSTKIDNYVQQQMIAQAPKDLAEKLRVALQGEDTKSAKSIIFEMNKSKIRMSDVEKERDQLGRTTLMIAVEKGLYEVVRLLLDKGADPNLQDRAGNTVLMMAVYQGDDTIIDLLIAKNANKSIKNKKGKTAYEIAKELGRKEDMLAKLR